MSDKMPGLNARTQRTLAALREALLALLEHKQFEDITIKDLVEEAGIGPATFYRHYPTKAALLEAVAASEIELLVERAVGLLNSSGCSDSAIVLAKHVDKHRALWTVLLSGGAAATIRQGFIRRLTAAYAEDQSILPGSWLPTDLGITFGAAATLEVLAWWLNQSADVPVDKVAEYLDRLAIRPTLEPQAVKQVQVPGTFQIRIDGNIIIEAPGLAEALLSQK